MRSKLLYQEKGLKTYALVFDKDEEVTGALMGFAGAHRLSAAQVTAIGAFSEVTIGYFDRRRKKYQEIPLQEQVEVLSFSGNISLKEGKPALHAHVVIGKQDGTAHGGHFLKGKVWPTVEMVICETQQHLRRKTDDETGLALIDLAA